MTSQTDKAAAFAALHTSAETFLLPNAWDAGSARLLEYLGFAALGTTSAGVAITCGRPRASVDAVLENVRVICAATALPVTADLEDCYAADPAEAAKTITRAAECGAVGGSIEDATFAEGEPLHALSLATERVHAVVEAARALPFPFVVTARAEGMFRRCEDLDSTIRRLQAYEAAGADVLYAPGIRSLDDMRTMAASLTKPVNVVMGMADPSITLADLEAAGVRRVSIGAGLARVAMQSAMEAAREMQAGRFGFVGRMMSVEDMREVFTD